MCGLNGIFAYGQTAAAVNRDELIRVRDSMAARGPESPAPMPLFTSPWRPVTMAL